AGEMGAACEHFLYDKGYGPTNLTLKQYLHALFPEFKPPRPVAREEFPLIEPTLIPIGDAPSTPRSRRDGREEDKTPVAPLKRAYSVAVPPPDAPPTPAPRPAPASTAAEDAPAAALTAPGRAAPIAAGIGLATAILVAFVTSGPVEIGARSVLWRWSGQGARLHERAVLRLPALRRLEEGHLAVAAR